MQVRIKHIALILLLFTILAGNRAFAGNPPSADFTIDNSAPVTGETITFTDDSDDGNGIQRADIEEWEWNFGEGASLPGLVSGIGPHNVFYTSTGTKQITLTITDEYNGQYSANRNVTVTCNNPSANISPEPASVEYGSSLQINGNPTGGSGTFNQHQWTGVGVAYLNATNIQNPIFSGAPVGTYNLAYTVTDSYGCSGTDNIIIVVAPKELIVTAGNQTVTYGDAVPVLTYSITGFVPDEDVSEISGVPELSTAYISSTPVSSGPVAIVAEIGTLAATNYSFSFVDGEITIGAKTLTPQISADNKCYDGTTTATLSSQTLAGVESGDVVSLEVTSSNFANVGPGTGITVTASGLSLSGTDTGNYSVVSTATTTADIFELPTATISGDATICEGELAEITVELTGTADWILTFELDGDYLNVENISANQYTFNVSQPGVYTVSAVSDANCIGTTSGSATINVDPLPATGEIIPD